MAEGNYGQRSQVSISILARSFRRRRFKEEHVREKAGHDDFVVLEEHDEVVTDREHIARYGSPSRAFSLLLWGSRCMLFDEPSLGWTRRDSLFDGPRMRLARSINDQDPRIRTKETSGAMDKG